MILIISFSSICMTPIIDGQNYGSYNFEFGEGSSWSKDCIGGHEWTLDLTQGHASNGSMKSTDLGSDTKTLGLGVSSLCRNVTGPAYISFWWKSETIPSRYGELSFLVNGKQKPIYSSPNWTNHLYYLPDNKTYKIEWRYAQKNSRLKLGAGWIDDVSAIPYLSNISTEDLCCIIDAPDLARIGTVHKASVIPQKDTKYAWKISDGTILDPCNNTCINWIPERCPSAILELTATQSGGNSASYRKNIAIMPSNWPYKNMTISQVGALVKLPKNQTTYVRKNSSTIYTYKSINEAIQNTTYGGTVQVADGIYKEKVIIDKPINLIGNDKNNTTIMDNGYVIYVNSDGVKIQNLTIRDGDIGIHVVNGNNCKILDSNIFNLTGYGIEIWETNGSIIERCNLSDINDTGIYLEPSNGCIIQNNSLSNIMRFGICLTNSCNNPHSAL